MTTQTLTPDTITVDEIKTMIIEDLFTYEVEHDEDYYTTSIYKKHASFSYELNYRVELEYTPATYTDPDELRILSAEISNLEIELEEDDNGEIPFEINCKELTEYINQELKMLW